MNKTFSDHIDVIFPRFVMHRKYKCSDEFNETLCKLASEDAIKNKGEGNKDPRVIGDNPTHIAHVRHNFLDDFKHPVIVELIDMAKDSALMYLKHVYHYDHVGELNMMADTFLQQRKTKENVGVICHNHVTTHLVVTYYVKADKDINEKSVLRKGSVRFYDPLHVNTRQWPNNNKQLYASAWYNVVPEVGSMLVFEGHIPHDSGYFDGDERLCIPIMVDVVTPRNHIKKSVTDLLKGQNAEV